MPRGGLSASALLKAVEQKTIAFSISAMSVSSEKFRGATFSRATLRSKSIAPSNCSRRSTPRIPSSCPPQAFEMAVKFVLLQVPSCAAHGIPRVCVN